MVYPTRLRLFSRLLGADPENLVDTAICKPRSRWLLPCFYLWVGVLAASRLAVRVLKSLDVGEADEDESGVIRVDSEPHQANIHVCLTTEREVSLVRIGLLTTQGCFGCRYYETRVIVGKSYPFCNRQDCDQWVHQPSTGQILRVLETRPNQ